MQTGRPSFLKMAGGLLIYPLYVVQVSLTHFPLIVRSCILIHPVCVMEVSLTPPPSPTYPVYVAQTTVTPLHPPPLHPPLPTLSWPALSVLYRSNPSPNPLSSFSHDSNATQACKGNDLQPALLDAI